MYPLLVAAFVAQAPKDFPDFAYPEEVRREGYCHIPILSYCRTQAFQAIRESGGLADFDPKDAPMLRWRASVPEMTARGMVGLESSRLELFMDNEDRSLRLVYSAPLCGNDFNALPLVLRLGIELLIRKECRGNDPE